MKEIGSLTNRLEENCYFDGTLNNIKVGTLCTVYYYTDRHAYEVVEVKDQTNLVIRRLKAVRVDGYGMSDAQNYRYESDPTAKAKEIKLTKNGWRYVDTFTAEGFKKCCENMKQNCKNEEAAVNLAKFYWKQNLTDKQFEKVLGGKEVTKLQSKVNISFGVADEYYDYSF